MTELVGTMRRQAGIVVMMLGLGFHSAVASDSDCKIWYKSPPPTNDFFYALPLGNGRIGVMVYGGVSEERLLLSESSFWAGRSEPGFNSDPNLKKNIDEMRRLFFEGKPAEANDIFYNRKAHGWTSPKNAKFNVGTARPFAFLKLLFPYGQGAASDYYRELDLDSSITVTRYRVDGVQYVREAFVSNPDKVAVMRLTCDKPGAISFSIAGEDILVHKEQKPFEFRADGDSGFRMAGNASSGVLLNTLVPCGSDGLALVRAVTEGGETSAAGSTLSVKCANSVTLYIAINTNYRGCNQEDACRKQIEAAVAKGYAAIRRDHVADVQPLFRRVSFKMSPGPDAGLPTDERLALAKRGARNVPSISPELATLIFQYARYLLIAGSREDSPLPLHLQGQWPDLNCFRGGWKVDFKLNINQQQNYWLAQVGNLAECHEPQFKLVDMMVEHGGVMARESYGMRGWVVHVLTTPWGYSSGEMWLWPCGGLWTSLDMWDQYAFTRDREFLSRRAYPVLKGSAEFFLDYLVEHPKYKWLVSGPSYSPENKYVDPTGRFPKGLDHDMGPTGDTVLIRQLFKYVIEGSETLGVDAEFRAQVKVALGRLPPFRVGKHGQIMEWLEEREEVEVTHRHTQHLHSLYPYDQIDVETTPELIPAVRRTLERRGANGYLVEWTAANWMCLHARLQDGDTAFAAMDLYHKAPYGFTPNLMSRSVGPWCIDGNMAFAAGMAEMLVQSHLKREFRSQESGVRNQKSQGMYIIHLLPALPKAWPDGKVTGLRARGGFEVDIDWKDGKLVSARITPKGGRKYAVRYGDKTVELDAEKPVMLSGELKVM